MRLCVVACAGTPLPLSTMSIINNTLISNTHSLSRCSLTYKAHGKTVQHHSQQPTRTNQAVSCVVTCIRAQESDDGDKRRVPGFVLLLLLLCMCVCSFGVVVCCANTQRSHTPTGV